MSTVRFSGLRGYLDRVLDDIALATLDGGARIPACGVMIRNTAERLEHLVRRDGLRAERLTDESRDLLGWFRYFSQEARYGAYVLAMQRVTTTARAAAARAASPEARFRLPQPAITAPARPKKKPPAWRDPIVIHFRPSSHLFRWRVTAAGTRIILPTPMVVFEPETFAALIDQMLGAARRLSVVRGMHAPQYKQVAAELAALGGHADRPGGKRHDLNASFDRVNATYFGGTFDRPRLTWGDRETVRKFGHYNYVQDLVMISPSLDEPHVPEFVVDHVMHHELLHKKHGVRWQGGKSHAHTPEFRQEERTFSQYETADRFLETLSRQLRCSRDM